MRFSDMMGSGAEAPEPAKQSESDGVIADALAPYLDADSAPQTAAAPTVTEPVADVEPPSAPAPAPAPAAATPTEPPAPVVRSWVPDRPAPSEPEPVMAAVSPVVDFTPLSDDLLPRRR